MVLPLCPFLYTNDLNRLRCPESNNRRVHAAIPGIIIHNTTRFSSYQQQFRPGVPLRAQKKTGSCSCPSFWMIEEPNKGYLLLQVFRQLELRNHLLKSLGLTVQFFRRRRRLLRTRRRLLCH